MNVNMIIKKFSKENIGCVISFRSTIHWQAFLDALLSDVLHRVESHTVGRLTHWTNDVKYAPQCALAFVQEQNTVKIQGWGVFQSLHHNCNT
ncbi:hypothetical protein B566_EDAN008500 [Ephemera danica]|nr:hypothetical protein B566_EDAN008500 [Ephemera danica]